jgi:superfamily II DNA or RNA helicase
MDFEELLARAAEPTLQTLVGKSGVRLLARLDPELVQPSKLREVAQGLTSPQEMLLEPTTRRELLGLLPPEKAAALAGLLGLTVDGNPYEALEGFSVRRGSERAQALLGFFGLVEQGKPAPSPTATVEEVDPAHPLFPHQRAAANRVLEALREEPFRVLLHMPTGAGKTRSAMHVIARMLNDREPMLAVWLAHSEELCEQAAEEFAATWQALGGRPVTLHRWWGAHELRSQAVGDGLLIAGLAKAYSAGQRSVETIGELAGRVGLVVIDEAHQAVAPAYQHVLDMLTGSGRISPLLGLTATPGRTWDDPHEDEKLAEFFYRRNVQLEVPGYESPIEYLVAEGYLARTEFVSLNYGGGVELSERDLTALSQSLEIPDMIIDALAKHEQRNLLIVNRVEAMAQNHPRTLVFAATVEHAVLLSTVLRARGIHARAITGQTPQDERKRIIDDFRDDEEQPKVLVNYGVLTAGFDAPRTSAVIIARPTKSLVLYSQMVGRATRGPRAGGNAEATVVTVVDTELPGFASLVQAFHNWEDVWQRRP